MFPDVAGDEHPVDALRHGDADDLVDRGRELLGAGATADRLSDVPVRGVEQSQRRSVPLERAERIGARVGGGFV
jgi:hypothetical protein